MKARSLVSFIVLPTLVILLLSTAVQAIEYKEVNKEVKAEDILRHIKNGDDINLTNCRIAGELNVSKIDLETAPNLYFYKLLKEGYHKDPLILSGYLSWDSNEDSDVAENDVTIKKELISFGINENLSVVKGNITIKKSIFENDLDFSNLLITGSASFDDTNFNNPASFSGTNFNGYTDFSRVTFRDSVDFGGVSFNDDVDFRGASFDNSASFMRANFNDSTIFYVANFNDNSDFSGAIFNGPVDFLSATFNDDVSFTLTTFYDSADLTADFNDFVAFYDTTFNDSVDFGGANFKYPTYFSKINFNYSASFRGPDTTENIITSAKSCEFLRSYYKNEARYVDADNIYYNYRKNAQDNLDHTSLPMLIDVLSYVTCGYGLRLSHTIWCAITSILFFTIVYKNPGISFGMNKSHKNPLRIYWKTPGIYRLSDAAKKESTLSIWDALYFSISTFTTVGSGDLYPRDNFRKWVTLEGMFGWVILGIFMATLANILIRS